MKIYDSKKILPGLAIFVGLVLFPFMYNMGGAAPAPKPELPKQAKACVRSASFMKAEHMQLLDQWRNMVVRDHQRYYKAPDGKKVLASLQNNCLKCHTSKAKFCDQCHNYVGVKPYCWDCHLAPKENQ